MPVSCSSTLALERASTLAKNQMWVARAINSSGQSMLPGYDQIYGFDVSNAATNDVLNLP